MFFVVSGNLCYNTYMRSNFRSVAKVCDVTKHTIHDCVRYTSESVLNDPYSDFSKILITPDVLESF